MSAKYNEGGTCPEMGSNENKNSNQKPLTLKRFLLAALRCAITSTVLTLLTLGNFPGLEPVVHKSLIFSVLFSGLLVVGAAASWGLVHIIAFVFGCQSAETGWLSKKQGFKWECIIVVNLMVVFVVDAAWICCCRMIRLGGGGQQVDGVYLLWSQNTQAGLLPKPVRSFFFACAIYGSAIALCRALLARRRSSANKNKNSASSDPANVDVEGRPIARQTNDFIEHSNDFNDDHCYGGCYATTEEGQQEAPSEKSYVVIPDHAMPEEQKHFLSA